MIKVSPAHTLTAANWGDSQKLELGDQVFAAGNPFGLGLSLSAGIISALDRNIKNSMPDVMTAYPHAKVEVTPHGLLLKPSPAAVPKTAGPGFRLITG